ncbi:MAG: hypothetical protein WCE24_08335 [Pseudolabrys sp.]
MRLLTIKSKQLPRDVEANDTAVTIAKGPAASHHTIDQEENIFGRISFNENHLVARVLNGSTLESEDASHGELRIILTIPSGRDRGA